jgi:predicted TIM-barrel fold metal-dependent hydrolase
MRDGCVVVDAHAHIMRHSSGYFSRDGAFPIEKKLAQMDECGIDIAFAIAHGWTGWTIEQYRHEHDEVAGDRARFPDRFIGCAWVDPKLGKSALEEAERCVSELGYRGFKLHPVHQKFVFDDPMVYPVVELAAKHGIPVMAHLELRYPGAEPWRMVTLARRYPEVTFIMAHMGSDVENVEDLTVPRLAARVPNIILETSGTTTDPYGTFGGPIDILGPERVVYGSDAGAFHHPLINLLKVDLLELPAETKRLVLGGNMLRILGLEARQAAHSTSGAA